VLLRGARGGAGAGAGRGVVAPRDLMGRDPAATARRRLEAASEVVPVYDWDSAATQRLEKEIRESFRKAREAWAASRHRGISSSVRDAFDLPIGDEALAALARLNFSRAVEERLISAAAELYRVGVVDNRDLLLENHAR